MLKKSIKIDKTAWILLSVIVLGVILRIYDLGAESLWQDEAGSIDQATRDLPSLFFGFHLSPLYFFLLRYWIRLFGASEFALRLPSAMLGVGSIFLIYTIGKILFDKKTGLISSLILAISPFHIFYSQETRHYALFVFLTLLSMLFFLRILKRKKSESKPYIYYGIVTVMLLYTTLWGVFIVIIQNLFFFVKKIGPRKKWIMIQAAVLAIFLIWLVPFVVFLCEQREFVKTCIQWIPKPEFRSLIETFQIFNYGGCRYGGWDFFIGFKEIGFSQSLLYIMGIFFILGLIPSRRAERDSIFFINLWLFIPIVVMFTFSLVYFSIFLTRYLIFASLAYYILVAKGISRMRNSIMLIGVVLVVLILSASSLTTYYTKELKLNWRKAIEYVETNIRDNEIIVIAPSDRSQMFSYYGAGGVKFQNKNRIKIDIINELGIDMLKGGFIYEHGGKKLIGVQNLAQLKKILNSEKISEKHKGIWFIAVSRWFKNHLPIKRYLDESYEKKSESRYNGVDVYLYKKLL